MGVQLDTPAGWIDDRWKDTREGHEFLIKREEDEMMGWVTPVGGYTRHSTQTWSAKVGTSTRLNKSQHVASGCGSRTEAVMKLVEWAENHPGP